METLNGGFGIGRMSAVRFHLGSGINGNVQLFLLSYSPPWGIVRFHLGSGINGNHGSDVAEVRIVIMLSAFI